MLILNADGTYFLYGTILIVSYSSVFRLIPRYLGTDVPNFQGPRLGTGVRMGVQNKAGVQVLVRGSLDLPLVLGTRM